MLALSGLEKFSLVSLFSDIFTIIIANSRIHQMNEDQLLNFAHALTDSRKTMAESFASALHRRMK